jgi:hypothetical protein
MALARGTTRTPFNGKQYSKPSRSVVLCKASANQQWQLAGAAAAAAVVLGISGPAFAGLNVSIHRAHCGV